MKNAEFQFDSFLITKSLFEINNHFESLDLIINFKPSGKLDKKNSLFNLILGIVISDKANSIKIEIEVVGYFKYSNIEEKKLNDFLYQNAPAILFPYIRAYISALTTLSGINPIVLPTLNLVSLKDDLSGNIEEIDLS